MHSSAVSENNYLTKLFDKSPVLTLVAGVLLCLIIFLAGINRLPMVDNDPALFAQASKQMIATHEYGQIKFQDQPRHRKPPGFYWLQSISHHLTAAWVGTMVSFRLPSVLASLCGVLLMGFFTRRVWGVQHAVVAAVALAVSCLFVIETHFADTNTTALLPIIMIFGALWQTYHAKQTTSTPWLLWGGVALGLVIKGVAPLFAILPLLTLRVLDGQYRCRDTYWRWGLAFCVLSVMAWAIPLSLASARNFIWDMISIDFLPRLGRGIEQHGHWPGYYTVTLHGLLWPFNYYFWPLLYVMASRFQRLRFPVIWLLANLVVLELVPTKLFNYTLPLFPALCVLISEVVVNFPELSGALKRLHQSYIVVWLAMSLLFTGCLWLSDVKLLAGLSFGVVWLGFLFSFYVVGVARFFGLAVSVGFFYVLLFGVVLPDYQPLWLTQRVAHTVQATAQLSAQHPLVSTYFKPSLVYYLGTHNVTFMSQNDLNKAKPELFLIEDKDFSSIRFPTTQLAQFEGIQFYQWDTVRLRLLKANIG